MLTLEISKDLEMWDDRNERFLRVPKQTLTFEHSLVSISKWESKWEKPFFSKGDKTNDEMIDYISCMCITRNVPHKTFVAIAYDKELMSQISSYLNKPMTATKFKQRQVKPHRGDQSLTSERIYYLMIAFGVPVEFEKWHINRLLTLIEICDRKNTPNKKMSKADMLRARHAENEARKKAWHTRG